MRNHLMYKHPSVNIAESDTGEGTSKARNSGSGCIVQCNLFIDNLKGLITNCKIHTK